MLNKDKVDEVEADLDAVKSERNQYIPRAIIKRLKEARLMPFTGRSALTDGAGNDDVGCAMFYVI